jgi:hypothetical protein
MNAPLYLVTHTERQRELDALHIGQIEADRDWLRQRLGEVKAQRNAARKDVGLLREGTICLLYQLAEAREWGWRAGIWAFLGAFAAVFILWALVP